MVQTIAGLFIEITQGASVSEWANGDTSELEKRLELWRPNQKGETFLTATAPESPRRGAIRHKRG